MTGLINIIMIRGRKYPQATAITTPLEPVVKPELKYD
jgi:hypothetical protein